MKDWIRHEKEDDPDLWSLRCSAGESSAQTTVYCSRDNAIRANHLDRLG